MELSPPSATDLTMKHRLLIILLTTLCAVASASAQSIRTLGFNSTNGRVVAATNVVWTNSFNFSTNTVAAQVRTNLGLGLSSLTNTNNSDFLQAIGITWAALTNTNTITFLAAISSEETNSLQLGNLSIADSGEHEAAGIVLNGNSRTVKVFSPLGNEVVISETNISYNTNAIFDFEVNQIIVGKPLSWPNFTNAAETRTNLSIGWSGLTNTNASGFRNALELSASWLTNTNVTNFQSAIGLGATNSVTFAAVAADGASLTNLTATNLTGEVAVANGGTGASSAATARTNLFGHSGVTTNISVVGTNNTNVLVFTNGLLSEVQ